MNSLKEILKSVLKQTPQFEDQTTRLKIYELWPTLVGETLAKHSWCENLAKDGTLWIASTSSSWLNALRYAERDILNKYTKALPGHPIKCLKFKISLPPKDQTES